MKNLRFYHPTKKVFGTFYLPASKSESNRALIINKLSGNNIHIENLSDADDTQQLLRLLLRNPKKIDVGDAGTSMRFLIACFCALNINKVITGSHRMQQRPIGKLVNALRDIGFQIHYLRNEGFPPVEVIPIENKYLKLDVNMDANESSQYISALLMIAPLFAKGLTIKLQNDIVSEPYIEMTLQMMKLFGIDHSRMKNEIRIEHQEYKKTTFKVDTDWTASSYWYSIAALSDEAEIFLEGLSKNSLQGDKIIAEWMKPFGIDTEFFPSGIKIKKDGTSIAEQVTFDFTDYPDLAQTIIVLAAAKNITLTITGIQTLTIKETDRIGALQNELKKMGAELLEEKNGVFILKSNFKLPSGKIETYNDHRMAMAFAPLALKGEIEIVNPSVVTKSYPAFWDHLNAAQFETKSRTKIL